MPERDGYIPGVPCWIDTSQPDPEAAVEFYRGLFGWEFEDVMPPDAPGKYFIARIRGGDVAAVGSTPEGTPPTARWNTYIWVESADDTAAKVRNAGAIFLGSHTPEAIGDYVGGSNHVLPTARSARFSSGLGVLDFMKRTSILKCGPDQLRALGAAAMTLGKAEGLDAHSRSVGLRLNLP